jgi:hypothetical protein
MTGNLTFVAGALACSIHVTAIAHPLSAEECAEGGQFIRHAAMSRDAGMTKQAFMNRLAEDIALVQAFPPHLRWFVQDEQDERLLSAAAARVFDQPAEPEQHEATFIGACNQTTAWQEGAPPDSR